MVDRWHVTERATGRKLAEVIAPTYEEASHLAKHHLGRMGQPTEGLHFRHRAATRRD